MQIALNTPSVIRKAVDREVAIEGPAREDVIRKLEQVFIVAAHDEVCLRTINELRELHFSWTIFLRRITCDPRMQDAFPYLTHVLSNDEQYLQFVDAAFVAAGDFSRKKATAIRELRLIMEIGITAGRLADLLGDFQNSSHAPPPEFFLSVCEGTAQPKKRIESGDPFEIAYLKIICALTSKAQLCAARTKLLKLAGAAYRLRPPPETSIELLGCRQRNDKTDYIRSFWSLLKNVHGFKRTNDLMHAMAIAATVANDGHDFCVTYDDVRKCLDRLDRKSAEGSSPMAPRCNTKQRRKTRRPKRR